jgi:hypothetical protein
LGSHPDQAQSCNLFHRPTSLRLASDRHLHDQDRPRDPILSKEGVIAMLRTPADATIASLVTLTELQRHSVRGFLAGVVRKKLGLNLVSEQTDNGRFCASEMARLHQLLRTRLNGRPDAMQKKLRNGRASTKRPVEDEIAHLRGLDLKRLRSRWQSVFQRSAPAHLTRHLLFATRGGDGRRLCLKWPDL